MDLQMPILDGLAAARAIRETRSIEQPAIIALTADAMPDDKARVLAAGMDEYLAKPVRLEDLAEALAKVPRRQRADDAR
jgi:CheY-like chemotaxis protein